MVLQVIDGCCFNREKRNICFHKYLTSIKLDFFFGTDVKVITPMQSPSLCFFVINNVPALVFISPVVFVRRW